MLRAHERRHPVCVPAHPLDNCEGVGIDDSTNTSVLETLILDRFKMKKQLYAFVLACVLRGCEAKRPNVVFILTDDQDIFLDGMTPLKKTRELLGEAGTRFDNAFVATPICCPSRASFLTGLYPHNHGTINNTVEGGCASQGWQQTQERTAFAVGMQTAGYETWYAGKYLNQYGSKPAGGVEHVPPGWDHWTGLVGNSKYYNYTLSVDGKAERHGDNYTEDYFTDVISRRAQSFIHHRNSSRPFLMVLAPPSAHAPFTPAPKYKDEFSDRKAPRTPSYDFPTGVQKHWLMRQPPLLLTDAAVANIDEAFRNRWRTLLSVDDMVSDVIQTLNATNELDNTFVIFTSDHGYHLGQFTMTIDKRLPYEFDIRVPMYVRGPGVPRNVSSNVTVLNIDHAPTLLDIAGQIHGGHDGLSYLPTLTGQDGAGQPGPINSRSAFLIEYHGEGGFFSKDAPCQQSNDGHMSNCIPEFDCKCQDTKNNTYNCMRTLDKGENSLYCLFEDEENYQEFYDLNTDVYQINNTINYMNDSIINMYRDRMQRMLQCERHVCQGREPVEPKPQMSWWQKIKNVIIQVIP